MADHASGEASGSSGSSPQPSPTRITSAGRFTVAPAEDDGDNDGDGGVNDIVDEEMKVDAVSEEGPPVDPPVAEPSADDGNDQWPNPTPASESDANGNIDDEQAATDEVSNGDADDNTVTTDAPEHTETVEEVPKKVKVGMNVSFENTATTSIPVIGVTAAPDEDTSGGGTVEEEKVGRFTIANLNNSIVARADEEHAPKSYQRSVSDEGIPIPWGAPGDIGPILRFFVHDLIKPLVAQQQNVRSRSNSIASSVDMGHAADDEGSVDGSQNGHDGGDLAPGSARGVTSAGRFNVEPAKSPDPKMTRFSVSDCPHEADEDEDSGASPDAGETSDGGPATLTESTSQAFQFPSPSPLRPPPTSTPAVSTPVPNETAPPMLDGSLRSGEGQSGGAALDVDFAAVLVAQNVLLQERQKKMMDQLYKIELAVGMSMVSTLEKEIETLRADKRALESSNRALQEHLDAAQAKNTQMTQELDYFKHANASQQQLQQQQYQQYVPVPAQFVQQHPLYAGGMMQMGQMQMGSDMTSHGHAMQGGQLLMPQGNVPMASQGHSMQGGQLLMPQGGVQMEMPMGMPIGDMVGQPKRGSHGQVLPMGMPMGMIPVQQSFESTASSQPLDAQAPAFHQAPQFVQLQSALPHDFSGLSGPLSSVRGVHKPPACEQRARSPQVSSHLTVAGDARGRVQGTASPQVGASPQLLQRKFDTPPNGRM